MFLIILLSLFAGAAVLLAGFILNNALTIPEPSATTTPEQIAAAKSSRLALLILASFLFLTGILLFVVSHLLPPSL